MKIPEHRLKLLKIDDAGFTLVEMLVAMMIAIIFFASFTAVIMATMQTLKTGDQRVVAQQNARIAISFLADEIKQMAELEYPAFSEYRDLQTGGLPRNGEVRDTFNNLVYPIYRRSTDSSNRGYIDLHHADAPLGIDEYEDFRDDGMPFDVRPLFPNRINFLLAQSTYLPHTRYSNLNPEFMGAPIHLDGPSSDVVNNADNAQAAKIRVSYEHSKQPPRWGVGDDRGLRKNLYLPVLSSGGVTLYDKKFLLLRNFQIENITADSPNDIGLNATIKWFDLVNELGTPSGVNLPMPNDNLRQLVAEHIADVRFKYFHIRGNMMIEIRYDPYTDNMESGGGRMPSHVNDGYYRYYDTYGQEIYVWATPDDFIDLPGPGDDVWEHYQQYDAPTFMPVNEFERGTLLFEGWRLVNAVMITVKAMNPDLQNTFLQTISDEITYNDPNHTAFGLGFTDFQRGESYINDFAGLNAADPLWHSLDSYRDGLSITPTSDIKPWDADVFDFALPNTNPAFDPGRLVTLQTIVRPPILQKTALDAVGGLRYGLSICGGCMGN